MRLACAALALLAGALICGPAIAKTELLSIKLPTVKNQYIDGFKVDTWGVDILAVCHVPVGWRITAGHYEDSQGVLSGETKEGRDQPSAADFSGLFLVQVHDFRANSLGDPNNGIPASFAGSIHVGPFGELPKPHSIPLRASNFERTPARGCGLDTKGG